MPEIDLFWNTTPDGFFFYLIPDTKNGEYIYNTIHKKLDSRIPINMKDNVLLQIRSSGYSVRKLKIKLDTLDQILSELDEL